MVFCTPACTSIHIERVRPLSVQALISPCASTSGRSGSLAARSSLRSSRRMRRRRSFQGLAAASATAAPTREAMILPSTTSSSTRSKSRDCLAAGRAAGSWLALTAAAHWRRAPSTQAARTRLKAPPASIAVDSSAIDMRVLPRRAPSSCASIAAPSGSTMASTARTKRSRTWRARPGSGRAKFGGVTMGDWRRDQYRTHGTRKSPARRDKCPGRCSISHCDGAQRTRSALPQTIAPALGSFGSEPPERWDLIRSSRLMPSHMASAAATNTEE